MTASKNLPPQNSRPKSRFGIVSAPDPWAKLAYREAPNQQVSDSVQLLSMLDKTDTRETITAFAESIKLKPEYIDAAFKQAARDVRNTTGLVQFQALKTSIPVNGEDHTVKIDMAANELASLYLASLKPVEKTFLTTGRDALMKKMLDTYEELYKLQISYADLKPKEGQTQETLAAHNAHAAIGELLNHVKKSVRDELGKHAEISRQVRRLDVNEPAEIDAEDYEALAAAAPNEPWLVGGTHARIADQDPADLLGDYKGPSAQLAESEPREIEPVKPQKITPILHWHK